MKIIGKQEVLIVMYIKVRTSYVMVCYVHCITNNDSTNLNGMSDVRLKAKNLCSDFLYNFCTKNFSL